MTEMHERLWHEWYDLWHEADASASKPSYEDWLEARIEELEEAEKDLAWVLEWSPQMACELRLHKADLAAGRKP